MFILRQFRYYIYDELLRTEAHLYHFERISASHQGSFWGILSPHRIRKIPHQSSFLFSFIASQLRTAVHIWPLRQHIEFETLRTEIYFFHF